MAYSQQSKPKWYWYVGRTLGILWALPATVLVWVFYILPMYLIARDLVFVRWAQYGVAEFILADKDLEKWYVRLWRDWGGWGGPGMFIWKGDRTTLICTTRFHELEHVKQQFYLGIFFYPAYILSSIFIWLFLWKKHSYYDNPFEVAARRAAGQTVGPPPGGWRDRWSWWILLVASGMLTVAGSSGSFGPWIV